MKTLAFAIVATVLLTGPAFAQQMEIRSTPPGPAERLGDVVAPGPYYDVTEPRENPWYPEGVKVPYDPAFIKPASKEYESTTSRGRLGLAGWTSQNPPVGASGVQYRDQPGWLQFGFAITWGAPLQPVPPPAKKPAPTAAPANAPATAPAPAPAPSR
jgi:hypothetical protein